jgi:hypothetical protein
MKLEVLLRAAEILRSQPAYTMSLAKLHAQLVEDLGAGASTYAQTYADLKNRPQSFMLLDTPKLLDSADSWPAQVREQYDEALNTAGLGACVRVMLAEQTNEVSNDVLALANATLAELSRCSDPIMLEHLARATEAIEEISAAAELPTTHPRGPRSGS